jgi:hypothetical protein
MIVYEEIRPFLGEFVDVGVAHRFIPGRLFWFYGKLIQINNDYVKLKIREGFKLVAIDDIQQIHLRKVRL